MLLQRKFLLKTHAISKDKKKNNIKTEKLENFQNLNIFL